MTTFAKKTADYLPADHIQCAREIAEALYLDVPERFEIQVARILQHLTRAQVRIRSCNVVTLPSVASTP
jgi:hypothetical protein